MKDMTSTMTFKRALSPAVNTNLSTTPLVSEIIDRQGYESLTFAIITGALTDADAVYAVLVEDGDDAALGDAAAVVDEQLVGTEVLAAFTFANDNVCRKIGYVGNKRYVRMTITPTTTAQSGDTPLAVIAILGNGHIGQQVNPPA